MHSWLNILNSMPMFNNNRTEVEGVNFRQFMRTLARFRPIKTKETSELNSREEKLRCTCILWWTIFSECIPFGGIFYSTVLMFTKYMLVEWKFIVNFYSNFISIFIVTQAPIYLLIICNKIFAVLLITP